jgi:hypothetical protein
MNLLFFNVHGINNIYNLDTKEQEFINTFQIIGLSETWHTYDIEQIGFLTKYNILSHKALRGLPKGRPSGGLVLLIDNKLKYNIIKINDSYIFIEIMIGNYKLIVGSIYCRPSYKETFLNEITNILDELEDNYQTCPIILAGDFNHRIGGLQSQADSCQYHSSIFFERETLDPIVNKNSRKLTNTLELRDFIVLNGRTTSDHPAQFTYHGPNGNSVCDLAWINSFANDIITDFQVSNQIITSDHNPILIKTNLIMDKNKKNFNHKSINTNRFKWKPKNKVIYTNVLKHSNRIGLIDLEESNNILNNNLQNAIVETSAFSKMSFTFKNYKYKNNPWFDREISNLKRKLRKTLRKAKFRKFETKYRKTYLFAKKLYKTTLNIKRKHFYEKVQLKLNCIKNPKEFWKSIKFFNKNQPTTNEINLEDWTTFFENKFKSNCISNVDNFAQTNVDEYLDMDISASEVTISLNKLKNNKTPGPDQLSTEFYKYLPENWIEYLTKMFNKVWNNNELPNDWTQVEIKTIYKKGNKLDPKNYRCIALTNTILKVFTQILTTRLSNWAESKHILPEEQSGFRTQRSCVDNLFILLSLIQLQLGYRRKPLYVIFVDFEAAFDSVEHHLLFHKLHKLSVSSKLINILKSIYNKLTMFVTVESNRSNKIPIKKGILQGDPISPLIFSLFISDLSTFFRQNNLTGIQINNVIDILMLLYADDLIIFCDSVPDTNNKLKCLETYCNKWELKVNVTKSKILVFHRGKIKKNKKFYFKGNEMEVVNKYNYLGVNFYSSGLFKNTTEDFIKKGITASSAVLNLIKKGKITSWNSKLHLYNSVVQSSSLYGVEIWGIRYLEIIEKTQLQFLKRVLCVDRTTPNSLIRIESGRLPVSCEIFKRVISWIIKVLAMGENRYPKHCLEMLVALDDGKRGVAKYNWVTMLMKNFFDKIQDDTARQCIKLNKMINTQYYNMYKEHLTFQEITNSFNSRACPNYSKINPNSILAEHLINSDLCYNNIKCITQIRLAHKLHIKFYFNDINIKINCRDTCKICNLEEETLEHLFFRCPGYHIPRQYWLMRDTINNVLMEVDKIMVLLNGNTNTLKCIYNYVYVLCKTRQYILNIL